MIIVPDELLGWREADAVALQRGETLGLRAFTREASDDAKKHLAGLEDIDLKDLKRNMEWIALPSLLLALLIVAVLFSLDLGSFAFGLFIVYGALVFAMAFADDSSRRKRMRARRSAWLEFVRTESHAVPDGLPFQVIRSDNDLLIEKLSKISVIEGQLLRDDFISPLTTGDEAREELLSARRDLLAEVKNILAPLSVRERSEDYVVLSPSNDSDNPLEGKTNL